MTFYEEIIKAATDCSDERARAIFDEMAGAGFDFSEAERSAIEREARLTDQALDILAAFWI